MNFSLSLSQNPVSINSNLTISGRANLTDGTNVSSKSLTIKLNNTQYYYNSTTKTLVDYDTGSLPSTNDSGQYAYVLETPSTVLSSVSTSYVSVSTFPISAIPTLSWLSSSDYSDYYFYTYIPLYCDVQVEGVINWDDVYTTLNENNSALSAWYGENQTIDILLNYDLHQGLQFNME